MLKTKNYIQSKTRMQKPYPIWNQNDKLNTLPVFLTKMAKKPDPLGLHIPI